MHGSDGPPILAVVRQFRVAQGISMKSKLTAPGHPPSSERWFSIAREVVKKTVGLGHGQRQQIYIDEAGRYRIHPDSVKRAVTAFKIVERMKAVDSELANRLRIQPVVVVTTFARWYGFNKAEAVAALGRYTDGQLTTRTLIAEEKVARQTAEYQRRALASYQGAYRHDAFDAAYGRLIKDWRSDAEGVFDVTGPSPFAYTFSHRRTRQKCVILVPGPFRDRGEWVDHQNGFMLHAVGAAHLGHQVLIFTPEGLGLKSLLSEWLRLYTSGEIAIEVIETELRELPVEDDPDVTS